MLPREPFRRIRRLVPLLGLTAIWAASALSGQAPSKEYIRIAGRVVAIEGPQPPSFTAAPLSQHWLAGGGTGTINITTNPGNPWTATTAAPWIAFLSPSMGGGSEAFQYLASPNSTSTALTGTITFTPGAGPSVTITVNQDAALNVTPTLTLLNSLTNGSLPATPQQNISFRLDSPNGLGYFGWLHFLINNQDTTADGCYLMYFPEYNALYFFAPDGSTQTQYVPGTPGTAASYHCGIDMGTSSIVTTATSATFNLNTTLRQSSVGTQYIFLSASDYVYAAAPAPASGYWATWMPYPELTTNSPTFAVTPAPVSGASEVLHFKFSDGNGFRYIDWYARGMITNDALNSACDFDFFPYSQSLTLYTTANGLRTYVASGKLGSGGVISSGGGCTINLNTSVFHFTPNPLLPDPNLVPDWYLDLAVTLDTVQVPRPVGIYLETSDRAQRGLFYLLQSGTWPP